MKTLITTLILGAVGTVSFGTAALAADRTVCFNVVFKEDRSDCASDTTTGNLRGCGSTNDNMDAVGHIIELWDKDDTSADEYIGRFIKAGSGRGCATFPWEGESYQNGETHPDVYLKYPTRARKTTVSGAILQALNKNEVEPNLISWRDGTVADDDAYVAVNCPSGVNCEIIPSGAHLPSSDISSNIGIRIMALDSGQHMLQVFGTETSGTVEMVYPCPTCGSSYADDRYKFYIDDAASGTSGMVAPHELGHVLQMQQFNQDMLRDVCGGSHGLTTTEAESCATTEGFADYVAGASWWDDNNAGSNPSGWGFNFETAAPWDSTCSDNSAIEGQVARGFWDLVDSNNEAGAAPASADDTYNTTNTWVASGWDEFANGTGNRDDYESDDDGVNLRDYYHNNSSRFGAGFFTTLLNHNCTGTQDNG